jgi:hypothetical protein
MLRNRCDVGPRASSAGKLPAGGQSNRALGPAAAESNDPGRRRGPETANESDRPTGRQYRAGVARASSEADSASIRRSGTGGRKRDAPQRCLVGVTWSVVAPLDVCGGAFGPIVRPVVSAATAAPKLAAAFAALTDLWSRRNFRADPSGNRCPLAFPVRVSCP